MTDVFSQEFYRITGIFSPYCISLNFLKVLTGNNFAKIRVARFGELSPECVNAYYKYGCALLYKAQEETDPLGAVPKKEGESQQESAKDGSAKNVVDGESSGASASSKGGDAVSVSNPEGAANDGRNIVAYSLHVLSFESNIIELPFQTFFTSQLVRQYFLSLIYLFLFGLL